MGKVKILSPELIAKIAAGEVIERPASVVKELMENALDAGSTEMKIETQGGGRKLIRVSDDGEGMSAEDALLSWQRHATSKIEQEEDLADVRTFGFRGEALSAIAAVSRMKIVTRQDTELSGAELHIEGGLLQGSAEVGCSRGTMVEIRDLFFNTPARLKFLKRPGTELAHMGDVVAKIALANPQTHFQFYHEGKRLANYPVRQEPSARLAELLGREAGEKMHFFQGKTGEVEVEGYAGEPGLERPNSRGIYLFVNKRPIGDRLLLHAVLEAYRNLMPRDRYPAVILFTKLPPDLVDVNVHPSKGEVKFADSEALHRLVVRSIRNMLERAPWLNQPKSPQVESRESAGPYFQTETKNAPVSFLQEPMTFSDQRDAGHSEKSTPFLGQIAQTYLLFGSAEGLILIDQHAAHERIRFENLWQEFSRGSLPTHPLLIPELIELSFSERKVVEEHLGELERMGFILEPSGERTVWVKSVPQILAEREAMPTLKEMIRQLSSWEEHADLQRSFDPLVRLLACRGAVQASQPLNPQEAMALFDDLQSCTSPSRCPHGRPTLLKISVSELEKMFARK